MTAIRDIQILEQERDESLRPQQSTPAVMVAVDGSVEVSTRSRYVWVSEYNQPQSLIQVLNLIGAQQVEGNLVELGLPNQVGERAIIGAWSGSTDYTTDVDDLGALSVGPHRQAHQYPSEADIGADAVLVYQPAVQMLKCTGDGATLTVSVASLDSYYYFDTHKTFNGGTLDLTSSVPATVGDVRYVLVYLNVQTNALVALEGTEVPEAGMVPIPKPVIPENAIPSAFVKLSQGQSTIVTATHIVDSREFLEARSEGDGLYLRLDTANGPLTGELTIDGSADEVQLTVQGHSAQTSLLFVAENSAGTDVFTVSGTGETAIADGLTITGSADQVQFTLTGDTGQTADLINVAGDGTDVFEVLHDCSLLVNASMDTAGDIGFDLILSQTATSGTNYGQKITYNLNAAANSSSFEQGVYMFLGTEYTLTAVDYTGEVYGYYTEMVHQNRNSGAVDLMVGHFIEMYSAETGAVITNAIGQRISVYTTNGSITNSTGLLIDDIADGGTANYAIRTNAGNIVFNDGGDANTDIRIATDTEPNFLFIDGGSEWMRVGDWDTNYVEIDKEGDLVFVGNAGLCYSGISAVDNSTETTISSSGVAVQVTIFDTNSASNNATPDHTNDHVTVDIAGDYEVKVSATIDSIAGAASTFELTVQKNNGTSVVGALKCKRNLAGGAGEAGVISLSDIVALSATDTIEVWIENETNTQNYLIINITLSLVQVGG